MIESLKETRKKMNELEKKLLRRGNRRCRTQALHPHRHTHRCRSLVARIPVWLCVVGDELILLAVARRRYFERVSLADCQASHYGHATGELVIEPSEMHCVSITSPSHRARRSMCWIFSTRIANP